MSKQNCLICAWRENCSKRFCIPDCGARCPDFSRDISIKPVEDIDASSEQKEQPEK